MAVHIQKTVNHRLSGKDLLRKAALITIRLGKWTIMTGYAPPHEPDLEDLGVLVAEAVGTENGQRVSRRIRIVDRQDETTGLTAMMRMTGFPTAIVAAMLASREIREPGTHPQETLVSGDRMLEELARRGIVAEREQDGLD